MLEAVLDRDRALLAGHVDELRVAGDVAGGPDARVGRAHVGVDDDLAAGPDLDADRLQVQPRGARVPAGSDEELFGAELLASPQSRRPRRRLCAPQWGRVLNDRGALPRKRIADAVARSSRTPT
jgi:hypothetical protein